ncbi:N-acetylmuramoyl-L-alanine amidase [Enterococcus hirae]|nr:N-acetylmuramoyl-L-alanine amidase [Enterococcus hirae]
MKKAKAIRLFAASWLIAPTILSTQSVFATTKATQTSESSIVSETPSSTTSSSEPTSSSDSSTSGSSAPTEESNEDTTTRTLTIHPALRGKIQLHIVDETIHLQTKEFLEKEPLKISKDGKVEELKEGTKIAYTITPSANEKLISVEINGAQEVDYPKQTFTVGVADLSMTAVFEPMTKPSVPSEPEEETSDSSEPSTPDTEKPTKPDTGNSGSPGTNESGNSSNQSKPPGSTGSSNPNNNSQGSSSSSNNQHSTPNKANNTNRPNSTNNHSNKIENPRADSSKFVVKTPIEADLPVNTTSMQRALVKEAYKYLGRPYVWGAKGPSTFDCSGLSYYVYMKAAGHYIGGWTGEQQYAGTQIPVSQAQPGDLLFWGPASGVTHHVGIYIGNGKFIHAPQPGDHVRITSLTNYQPDFAVRVDLDGLPIATDSLKNSSILDNLNDSFHFSQNQTTDQFLKKVADDAQKIGQKEGIYASVMMAQAILESGSGNSLLSREPNYNLFGIKGTYKGRSISFNTLEQTLSGQSYQIRAAFRKYPSYKESLEDYAELIKKGLAYNKDFYKPTWKSETKNYKEATKYLEGRYATDRQYSKKLNAIIEAYDLTQYDEPRKEKKLQTKMTKQSLSFKVPVNWKKNDVSFNRFDFSSLTKSNSTSFYISELKFASIWDLWTYFSAGEIPQTLSVTVKPTNQPLVSTLTIDRVFWLDQYLNKR